MPGITNSLISAEHVLGHGGQANANATGIHERAFSAQVTNVDPSFQGISQVIANYNEVLLSLTPHFYGHAGGETDISGVRASINDARAGNDGTNPSLITGMSSQVTRATSTASMTAGGAWAAFRATVSDTGGGAPGATTVFAGLAVTASSNAGTLTNGQYLGVTIDKPVVDWPTFNGGLNVNSYGTGAASYDMTLGGVNAAGTPAGFNSATGPFSFGSQVHCASTLQICMTGGPIGLASFTNATLPASGNGAIVYCSDCVIAAACAGAGTGALAKRLNGAWVCN